MLFALDWIKRTFDAVAQAIANFIGGVTLPGIESALSGELWILIPCAVLGLALCLVGFRIHKLLNGLTGAVLLGLFGWNLGLMINSSLITVPILYAMVSAIIGFSLTYIIYVINIFSASFLLAWAACAAFPLLSVDMTLIISFTFALLYSILYAASKETMTALTGAILLGLITGGLFNAVTGAAVCAAFTAGGMLLQALLKMQYDDRMAADREEEIQKYPFGPGIRDAQMAQRSKESNQLHNAAVQEQGAKA